MFRGAKNFWGGPIAAPSLPLFSPTCDSSSLGTSLPSSFSRPFLCSSVPSPHFCHQPPFSQCKGSQQEYVLQPRNFHEKLTRQATRTAKTSHKDTGESTGDHG